MSFEFTYSIPKCGVEAFSCSFPTGEQPNLLLLHAAEDFWNEVLSAEEDWPLEIILHDMAGNEIARGMVDLSLDQSFEISQMSVPQRTDVKNPPPVGII